jgi:hypothetical protein
MPSLLQLLDRLLPPASAKPLQMPLVGKLQTPPSVYPILRRLNLQLATRILTEPSVVAGPAAGRLLTSATSDKAASSLCGGEASAGGKGMGYEEVYRRVVALAFLETDGGADSCILGALQSAERGVYEAAYRAMGFDLEHRRTRRGEENAEGPLLLVRFNPQSERLLSSSDLAKATPVAVVKLYVEQPTETRAGILSILVRHSPDHRAEFGRRLNGRVGGMKTAEKVLLASPVRVYLELEGGRKTKGHEGSGGGEAAEGLRAEGDAAALAKAYLEFVTEYLVKWSPSNPEVGLGSGLGPTGGSEGRSARAEAPAASRQEESVGVGKTSKKRKAKKEGKGEVEGQLGEGGGGNENGVKCPDADEERASKKRKKSAEENGADAHADVALRNGAPVSERGLTGVLGNAVELFRSCSVLVPFSDKERKRLLRKLLPAGGWSLEGEVDAKPSETSPTPDSASGAEVQREWGSMEMRIGAAHLLQKAAVARLLVLHKGTAQEEGAEQVESVHEEVDAKSLLKYSQTLMTSLVSLHRSQAGGEEIKRVKAGLEKALLSLLAEAAGLLPGLVTDKLVTAVASFAESVLRWRFGDVGSLTVVRLVLTAVRESAIKKEEPGKEGEREANGAIDMEADAAPTTDNGEARAETAVRNGVSPIENGQETPGGGVLILNAEKIAQVGSRIFDLVVSHSLLIPTLLASTDREPGAKPPNPKPLPEAMGKHSGDFVPSSLASILSLLDNPPPPVGLGKQTLQNSAQQLSKSGTHYLDSEGFGSAETQAVLSASITQMLSFLPVHERSPSIAASIALNAFHKSLLTSRNSSDAPHSTTEYDSVRSELVRLLSALLDVRSLHVAFGGTDSRSDDLLSLLLAAYGATMSDLDRWILHLMRQIDGQGGPGALGLVGMDFLWGERALHSQQEQKLSGEGSF